MRRRDKYFNRIESPRSIRPLRLYNEQEKGDRPGLGQQGYDDSHSPQETIIVGKKAKKILDNNNSLIFENFLPVSKQK